MYLKSFNTNFYIKEIIFFTILYIGLLVGFYFNENSTGGAYLDYISQKVNTKSFSEDFLYTLLNYDNFSTRHSPILSILLSFFEKLNFKDYLIRFIHLNFCLILPLIFYKSLKLKFKDADKKVLFLLVGLIFLSPTFRSLAIWPDSRLLGLTLFTFSIYYYLKFEQNKKFKDCILNIIFYTLASYTSPNFSVFSIFFVFKYISYYKLNSKILIIVLSNILLSLPAFYYLFVLDVNFLTKSAKIGFQAKENIFFNNLSNQILIIPSIIFFYLIPFFATKVIKIENIFNIKIVLISLLIFIISIYFFDYDLKYTGGGIFFKASNILFNNNFLFYFLSYLSIYFLVYIIYKKIDNFLIIILLIFSNPQITIYHKYYDPFMIILLFLILAVNLDVNRLKNLKNFTFIYSYFFIFLLMNVLKVKNHG